MAEGLTSPAEATFWFIQGRILFLILHLLGLACFSFIVAKRLVPLLRGQPDLRFDQPWKRLGLVSKYWFGQWRHPRYPGAGTIHLLIFAGFLLLAVRAFSLLILGVWPGFVVPGGVYAVITQYAATVVFLCMVVAAVRRGIFKPRRYAVPANMRDGTPDAIFLLSLIAILMAADALFEAASAAASPEYLAPGSMAWFFRNALAASTAATLQKLNLGAYFVHELAFFFLLCYRPFGIQFHVETSLFSIYFAKLDRELLKPVRWGVPENELETVKSFGVKTFEDFTWKHILDFYSCADCGRCSDQCPSNAVGRPLSPRLLTVKARDYAFRSFPVLGPAHNGARLVGGIYSEDEVWSCTTCGACEAECPMLVEYIDKIVDLRRGLIDEGCVPQSLQKPLKALESRGNPYGKLEKKRGDWAKAAGFPIVNGGPPPETLYFVDSITSYDERIQAIGRATGRILQHVGEKFAVLGPAEKDSGHDVRRFGEELLFQALRDHNTDAITASGACRIVTADPHAYNAFRHDYRALPPVEHVTQLIARGITSGNIRFRQVISGTYTYHDPCYLGRHNNLYDAPRQVLDSIPGLKRVEMSRHADRSFCCGGGGLALFYEPKEQERMGVKRVRMAAEAGADTIVTACPFCMVNLEDAIKVAGLEGKMTAIDIAELAEKQLIPAPAAEPAPVPLRS